MARDNFRGCLMQVSGPAVVSKSSPASQHAFEICARQSLYGRKFRQKIFIVGNYRGDACLLQHDFGNPDSIRVFIPPPREIPLALREPSQQTAAEFRKFPS